VLFYSFLEGMHDDQLLSRMREEEV